MTPLASPAAIAESDSTLLSTADGTDTTGSTVPGSSDPILTEDLAAGERINDPECVPAAEHPTPVLLLHGTSDNYTHVMPLAQGLIDHGYCVWAYTYGQGGASLPNARPNAGGMIDIDVSAREVAGRVDEVKAATGASKIDIVGHSQGGLLAKMLIQEQGKADSIRRVVGMGGNFHGTDYNGMGESLRNFINATPALAEFILGKSSTQQIIGSELLNRVNALPDTTAGITYTSLYSPADETVTPNSTSMLDAVAGADVANVNTSIACPSSTPVEHATMPQNPVTIGLALWGLERTEGDHTPAPDAHCAP